MLLPAVNGWKCALSLTKLSNFTDSVIVCFRIGRSLMQKHHGFPCGAPQWPPGEEPGRTKCSARWRCSYGLLKLEYEATEAQACRHQGFPGVQYPRPIELAGLSFQIYSFDPISDQLLNAIWIVRTKLVSVEDGMGYWRIYAVGCTSTTIVYPSLH